MYDNPENLSINDILNKVNNIGHGPNRNKRRQILYAYSTNIISKEEWIKKYCKVVDTGAGFQGENNGDGMSGFRG